MDTVGWECATVALKCGVGAVDSDNRTRWQRAVLHWMQNVQGPDLSASTLRCYVPLIPWSRARPTTVLILCNSRWRTFNVIHLLLKTCSHQHFETYPPLSRLYTFFYYSFALPSCPFNTSRSWFLLPFRSYPCFMLLFFLQSLHYFDLSPSYFQIISFHKN